MFIYILFITVWNLRPSLHFVYIILDILKISHFASVRYNPLTLVHHGCEGINDYLPPTKLREVPKRFIQTDLNKAIRLSRKRYILKEKTESIRWRLKSEKRNIARFDCQKAVGKFGRRTYTVWHTPKPPISVGTLKLDGLHRAIVEGIEAPRKVALRPSNIQYDPPRPNVPKLNPQPEDLSEFAISGFYDGSIQQGLLLQGIQGVSRGAGQGTRRLAGQNKATIKENTILYLVTSDEESSKSTKNHQTK